MLVFVVLNEGGIGSGYSSGMQYLQSDTTETHRGGWWRVSSGVGPGRDRMCDKVGDEDEDHNTTTLLCTGMAGR